MKRKQFFATVMQSVHRPIYGDTYNYRLPEAFNSHREALKQAKLACERLNIMYPRIEIERQQLTADYEDVLTNITEYEFRDWNGEPFTVLTHGNSGRWFNTSK